MAESNLEQILAEIRSKSQPGTFESLAKPNFSSYNSAATQIQDIEYDVPTDAIYDRLSDGTYIPRFESYKGAEGNEERLALQQGFWEQAWHGVTKNVAKVFTYAFDATVGTAYGLYNGIKEGSWDAVWNNELSNSIDDVNKKLDYSLPNYYTEEEKSNGLLSAIPGFGATNFWFNDVAGGMAFVGGAILPEIAIGFLSGGTTIGTSMAKLTARGLGKKLLREGVEEGVEATAKATAKNWKNNIPLYNQYEKGSNALRNLNRGVLGSKVAGDIVGTGLFLARTSNFEAGMEARHNFHQAIEQFHSDFEKLNGRTPTAEEVQDFYSKAKTAANYVYTANMGILSVSNAVMFSNKFNIGVQMNKKLNNRFNKMIGLGVESKGTQTVLQEATRGRKIVGNTYKILGKPATEGLYEEGLQGVAGTTMQNYLKANYDPDHEPGYGMWASLSDAFAHQYGSAEGWKEIGIGAIIGFMGGTATGQGFAGVGGNSWSARRKDIEGQVNSINQITGTINNRMKTASSMKHYSNMMKSNAKEFKSTDSENALLNVAFIQAQEQVKSRKEILSDFDAVVDNMQLTDEDIDQLGGEIGFEEYKNSLKEEFRQNMEDYKASTRLVSSLGLDGKVKDSNGNKVEVSQALTMNMVAGRSALQSAKNVASMIDTLIGSEGVFSHMEHYNNLSEEQKQKVQELRSKKRQAKRFRDNAEKYAREVEGIPAGVKSGMSMDTKHKRYKDNADKLAATRKKIAELDTEIAQLKESLQSETVTNTFNIDQLSSVENTHDIEAMVDELDKLDGFVESLRSSGRGADADALTHLIEEYKTHSDAHREMNNMFRRMYDTNFFSSKEGKSLLKSILGPKYEMSQEFRDIISENDQVIDRALKLVGQRGTDTVLREMEERFANADMSDREKYRMESIIRFQLGYERLQNRLEKLQEEVEISETAEDVSQDPMKGDTISVKQRTDSKGKATSNVEVLNKLIDDLASELDQFRAGTMDKGRLDELRAELEELNELKRKQDKDLPEGFRYVEEDEIIPAGDYTTKLSVDGKRSMTNAPAPEGAKTDVDKRIEAINEELTKLEGSQFRPRIVKSKEFLRVDELSRKQQNEPLSEEEKTELEELTKDIDQWIEIVGTVGEGMRLSDLIEQRAVLEETVPTPVENVGEVTSQDVIDSPDMPDKSAGVNYSIPQTYSGVTAVKSKGKIEISGIKIGALRDEVGFDFDYETNEQNNILITEEVQERINKESPISILPTNKNLTTNYSMVLKTEVNDQEQSTSALKTNYTQDFSEQMNPEAIYDLKPGDRVTLEVDPTDAHNKALLDKLAKANTEAARKKALAEMQKSLVIRVKDITDAKNFVGVLKAKRKGGSRHKNAENFEAFRNQVVNDEDFVARLLGIEDAIPLEYGEVTVEKVYLGHPNFNFTDQGNGVISIDHRVITEHDLQKIDDIGYVSKTDGLKTQSNKGDVDLSFMKKAMDKNPDAKLPFVVITKGGKRIAYPVKVQPVEMDGLGEFSNIYNSSVDPVTKVNNLNKMMAARGVDIKLPGNSFVIAGQQNNLNDKFFAEKLAQLESIAYFNSLDNWIAKGATKSSLISDRASIDINLSDPLHSPKVKLDFRGIEVDINEDDMPVDNKKNTVTKGVEKLDKIRKEDC